MDEPTTSRNAWLDRSPPLDIGPGPVRPPQPYVPLRKASPHRLQARKGGPHPLLYTGPRGVEPFRPGTSPSAASPDYAYATALHPQVDHNHESSRQTTRKNSFETVVPASAVEPGTTAWPSWENGGFGSPAKKKSPAKVRQSRSISEGMRGLRERLAWHQENGAAGGGIPGPDESWEELPAPHEIMPDEARTSFRSVMTGDSSYIGSYVSTERSSMATGLSSTSDFVKINSSSPVMLQDENFSVEDAIGMYADGFETPSKQSFDIVRDRSPERRLSSPQSPKRPVHLHRRSRSAVLTEAFSAFQLGQGGFSSPRSSPQKKLPDVISPAKSTGRDAELSDDENGLYPAAISSADPFVINKPVPPVPGPGTFSRTQTNGFKPVPRDRYGFKKVSHHVTAEEYDAWERPYSEHLERRRVKWDALMKQFGLSTDQPTRFPPKSEKIKRYARKGIPPEWRGAAWFWYAGGPGLQKKHEGVYFTLLQKIKRGEELKETDREHIERDLNRTFPDNLTFKPDPDPSDPAPLPEDNDSGPETPIIGALRRVLQAFAVHKPGIGYCQSLNFIAGLLLLFLDSDEEKSFLLLDVITTDYLPGTHGVSLEGANIDIAVLMTSLKELLPGVWAKIDDQPTTSATTPLTLPTVSLATTPWFLTLYLTTLPVESALRIWDVLFIEGSKTLFRAALAIFKLCEPRVRLVSDPMEVFQIVQTAPRSLLDANSLMELCFRKRGQGFGGLSQDTIERRREELRKWKRSGGRVGTDAMPGLPPPVPGGENRPLGIKGRFRSRTKGAKG